MQKATAVSFDHLLDRVAVRFPKMRIRFSTSNPQDMHEEVLHVIAKYPIFVNTFTYRFNLEVIVS